MMDEQFREISAIVLARVTRFRERLGALARKQLRDARSGAKPFLGFAERLVGSALFAEIDPVSLLVCNTETLLP